MGTAYDWQNTPDRMMSENEQPRVSSGEYLSLPNDEHEEQLQVAKTIKTSL